MSSAPLASPETVAIAATHLKKRLDAIMTNPTLDGYWETEDEIALAVLLEQHGGTPMVVKPHKPPPSPAQPAPTKPSLSESRHRVCGRKLITLTRGLYCVSCGVYNEA